MLRRVPSALLLVLAIHAALLTYAALNHSPGIDEPTYLAAGLNDWRTGYFTYANVTPPGARLIASSLAQFTNYHMEWDQVAGESALLESRSAGIMFLYFNRSNANWIINLARFTCIPLSILVAILCFSWSKKLYGNAAAFASLILWCFCPLVLTNGQMITPDMGATAFYLAAAYAFSNWINYPSFKSAFFAGGFLGAPQFMRTSALALYPAFFLAWIVVALLNRANGKATRGYASFTGLIFIFCLSLLLLNTFYGFQGSFKPLSEYTFISSALAGSEGVRNRFQESLLGTLPVPLPEQYLLGIDTQTFEFESGKVSYFAGEFRAHGWWYYYLAGLFLKLPTATLILIILATILCTRSLSYTRELPLILPILAILTFLSLMDGYSHHIRYTLPAIPLLYVWASRLFVDWKASRSITRFALAALIGWSVLAGMSVYPHSHAFFNSLAGGESGGPDYLLDSNIDWGQDIHYLNRWIEENPEAQPLAIGYFGNSFPNPFLLRYKFGLIQRGTSRQWINISNEIGPREGWYAISIHLLKHTAYVLAHPDKLPSAMKNDPIFCGYFLNFKPHAIIGHSIYIYNITREQADWIREQQQNRAN